MTKRTSYIFLILLILSANLFGQRKLTKPQRILLYAYQVDTSQTKVDSFRLSLDSIQIDVKTKNNKISTTNFFKRSKSLLTIDYYFKDKKLILVNIAEQCPKNDGLYSFSTFYYDKGKLFDEIHRLTLLPDLAYPADKSMYEIFGYNPNLNTEFLKKYIIELLDKIKLQPTSVLQIWLGDGTNSSSALSLSFCFG